MNAQNLRRFGLAALLALAALAFGLVSPLAQRGTGWLHVTWQNPWWALALLPLPWLLWRATVGQTARSARLRLGSLAAFSAGPRGLRARLQDVPAALRVAGLALCVLALTRPVDTLEPTVSEEEGIDSVIALDLSGSMEAVMEKLPPELERFTSERPRGVLPMRVEAAKAVLRDFIGRRRTDRIGVVVFAKDAYVLSPPTLDYQLLDGLVARMSLDAIDSHGTAIGDGIGVAVARLRRSEAKSKAILLVTDGDNQGGQLSPEYAAHLANVIGAKLFTVQIGEGDTARIFRGFNLLGQPRYETKAYPTNPALLKRLAETTGGAMYVASDAAELQATFHDVLDRLEKTQFEAAEASFVDLYRDLLLPGLVLLAFEALLAAFYLRRFP